MKDEFLEINDHSINELSLSTLWEFLQPGEWLNLEELPSPFAGSQALLLCEVSSNKWVTWIPNYGEYCLIL